MTGENVGWGAPPIGHNNPPAEVAVETPQLPTYEVKYEGQPPTEEPEAFRMRRNAEIQNWLSSKETAQVAVTNERDHRVKVTTTLFPIPKKGTQRYDLGNGYKVKLQHTITADIGIKGKTDDDGNEVTIETQVRNAEEAVIEEFGELGEQVLKRLITWKPNLSLSAWDKLDMTNDVEKQIKEMLEPLVTKKPGSPQLEFEEPKAEG